MREVIAPDAACSFRARQGVCHYTPAVLSRRTHLALGLLALGYCALLFWLAWARFSTVHQRTFDLALYARVAWGLARGDAWSSVLNTHALGTHVAPVLAPLGVLGLVFGTVPVLLLAQALCIALCVWPMARIGARRIGQRGVWLGALAWLLYPNLGHVGTYEFHPGTLAVLPLCWAFDALDRANFKDLCICVVLVLLCREDYALTTAMLGVAYFALYREPRAFKLIAASLVYFALGVSLGIALAPANGSYSQHFGPWGGTPLGVLRVLVTDPARVLEHFRAPERLWYLVGVLAPLSFFSLRAPWYLLVAAPTLAINLLSVFPTAPAQYSHYLSGAVPAIVAASVVGLSSIRTRFVHFAAAIPLLIAHVAMAGLPWSRDFDSSAFQADARTKGAKRVLSLIPANKSVQAPDPLLPHLAERMVVRRGPPPEANTDYVVLDLSHRERYAHSENLVRTTEEPLSRVWLSRADHQLLAYLPPYALLARGSAARSSPELARYFVNTVDSQYSELKLAACLSLVAVELGAHEVALTLRAHAACPSDLALRLGSQARPERVDLLFDGALSPALLEPGDVLRSRHPLDAATRRGISTHGLWLGLLRASGAPPEPSDPIAVRVLP